MDLNQTLLKIDSLKKQGESIQPAKREFEKIFWDKFRLEFNYNSNHIEGNTLTYGHTQLLLLFDKIGADYTGREIEEMKAHDLALKIIKETAMDPDHVLTEKFIKEINELILVRPYHKEAITPDGQPTRRLIEPGQYKKYPNSVQLENGEIFNYASPEETPALMGDLIDWYRKETESRELHPVHIAAIFHYRFVRIHPFDDSNGRTSRLMMNYILIKNGYVPLVVESTDKSKYLTALNKADTGDLEAFVIYISNLALYWQELYIKALKGEKIEQPEDFDKEIELLKKELLRNKGPKIEISLNVVNDILYKSFLPLFKSIEQKLNKFSDLFLRTKTSITARNFPQQPNNTNLIENSFQALSINLQNEGDLQVYFTHQGFTRAGTNAFDIQSSLTIQFRKYIYIVQINNLSNDKIEKLYDEILSENEIENLSQRIADIELQTIKEKIKNIKH